MFSRLLLMLALILSAPARADIIVLMSDSRPSISNVEQAIQAAYNEKIETYNLGGNRNREAEVARLILESSTQKVIVIGLQAAQLARQRLSSKQVVFCQVLNFEEFDLVTPWMKGVSAIPSLFRQFSAWKQLDPGLRRVGIITGRNTRYMIREAETAAKRLGLDLVHSEVSSEREVPMAAEELYDKKIQGLWLAPDSSILSQRAVMDLLAYSVKNNLQVLAFSPGLLNEGALLSTMPDFQEIARLVLERHRKSSEGNTLSGEPVVPLGTARISINSVAAARFGLVISPRLREQAHVQ